MTLYLLAQHYRDLLALAAKDKARYRWLLRQPTEWTRGNEADLVATKRAYWKDVSDPAVVVELCRETGYGATLFDGVAGA